MSRSHRIAALRSAAPTVLPSLLLCDFGNLEREVEQLEDAGVRGLHLDVMDGHFVPNLSYGMPIVEALRRLTDLPLDVHLMIAEPARYVRQFYDAGADIITIHSEAVPRPEAVLSQIRQLGAAAGVALNPDTPLSRVESFLGDCDLVLVMSVPAGFGGQVFDSSALDKLRALRQMRHDQLLEVDGGINQDTIAQCAKAGADLFVVGSAIFQQQPYGPVLHQLTELATNES